MKKQKNISSTILYVIGIIGLGLVGQGLISGEQLSSIQNITGMILGGGCITAGTLILVVKAIPEQAIIWLFKKAGEKYGKDAVDGALDVFKQILEAQQSLNDKVDKVISTQEEDREARNNLLNS